MFVTSFTDTEKKNIKIDRACQSIIVVAKSNPQQRADLKAFFQNVNVSVSIVPAEGRVVHIVRDESLLMTTELKMVGAGEGAAYASGLWKLAQDLWAFGVIPLTDGGSVDLGSNDYISLDITNPDAVDLHIYANESFENDVPYVVFEENAVTAPSDSKKMRNDGFNTLILPQADFKKVDLFGAGGTSRTIPKTELIIEQCMMDDIKSIAATDGNMEADESRVIQVGEYLFVDISQVESFEVTSDVTTGYKFFLR